jgi:hypothetical protein
MPRSRISEEEFAAAPAAAVRLADQGAVFIGNAEEPTYVLVKLDTFLQVLADFEPEDRDRLIPPPQTRPAEWIRESNRLWREGVPAGWQSLYDDLVEHFAGIEPQPLVSQAKEKLGGLRVYLERPHLAAQELIHAAMAASERTCQRCGQPGRLRNLDGYMATLCEDHAREEGDL